MEQALQMAAEASTKSDRYLFLLTLVCVGGLIWLAVRWLVKSLEMWQKRFMEVYTEQTRLIVENARCLDRNTSAFERMSRALDRFEHKAEKEKRGE